MFSAVRPSPASFVPTRPSPWPVEHPQGNVVLVLGVLGVLVPVARFVAWYLGNQARRDLEDHPGWYSNESAIRVGRLLGVIMSWLSIVSMLVAVLMLIFFAVVALARRSLLLLTARPRPPPRTE